MAKRFWNIRVLAVDDEPKNIELLSAIFEGYGCKIDTAPDGFKALALLDTAAYDVVITDIRMPVMDGLAFYKDLVRRMPSMKGKVIFTTSDLDQKSELLIKAAGCRYVLKPLSVVKLLDTVNEVVERRGRVSRPDRELVLECFLLFSFLSFFLQLLSGTAAYGGTLNHNLCKECHADVHSEAMSMPYKHSVVDERCGMCHVVERKVSRWTGLATMIRSTRPGKDVLLPLNNISYDKMHIVEVIAKDRRGRKSRPVEIGIDPQNVEDLLPDGDSPPEVFDIRVEKIRKGIFPEATLSWRTDSYTTSWVEYGPDTGYEETSGSGTAYSRSHGATLVRLKKNTVYHFRIVARDVLGNVVQTADHTFDTSMAVDDRKGEGVRRVAFDRSLPVIKDLKVVKTAKGGVCLLARFNKPSTVEVRVKEGSGDAADDPHGEGFLPPIVSQIDVCVRCHRHGLSHPVGVSSRSPRTRVPVNLPTLPGGVITCVTCHFPHGGDKRYFARLDFQRDICIECHGGGPFI